MPHNNGRVAQQAVFRSIAFILNTIAAVKVA